MASRPASSSVRTMSHVLHITGPLLQGKQVTHEGAYFDATAARLSPAPVQQPSVPIVVAGASETALRLVARHGHASNFGAASWAGGVFTSEDVRAKLASLREQCAAIGRPYGSVLRTALVGLVLADSAAAAGAKRDQFAPYLGFSSGCRLSAPRRRRQRTSACWSMQVSNTSSASSLTSTRSA
jgi:alkanesulfonate monooxygenase SsuD/methylene tetrahydromethanopterin reductase-like flavin-dependent oxidoreductase (luciferase family)